MPSNNNPRVIFVLGGPGSGKGTQCARACEKYGYKHISAGDCLREEQREENSPYKELIEDCITGGTIVPVEITCALLRKKMHALGWGENVYLIDGFPRNQDNFDGWQKASGEDVDVKLCLFIECPEECMEERLLNRGKSSGRSDDNGESIRKRFATFQKETMPIIEHFRKADMCATVDGTLSVEDVCSSISTVLTGVTETKA